MGGEACDCSRCDNPPRHSWGRYSFPPPPGCDASCVRTAGVLDEVVVPAELPAGKYVLGFRYDCDATAQVWSNCADISIV